jgi:cytochrome c oxidase cbb3-type subunit 3
MSAAFMVLALLQATAPPPASTDAHVPPAVSDATAAPSVEDLAAGRRLFALHCAACHGVDGRGGRGANLARPKLRRVSDDKALAEAIGGGIPGTEMPAVWQISESDVARVVVYVRSLGQLAPERVPGDATRGRVLYAARGCPACHVVNGEGGTQGPELTDVGTRRGVAYLRESLIDPGKSVPDGFLLVRIRTPDGRDIEGQRLNEDTFTIQVRGLDDRLYSFRKDALARIEKLEGRSPMPSYRDALTPAELDDLVAYLAGLRSEP